MPELPEVETVRMSLEPKLVGRRFEDVEILDSRLTRPANPAEVAAEILGERVAAADEVLAAYELADEAPRERSVILDVITA